MQFNTTHWRTLTAEGLPVFYVWRRPLTVANKTLNPGDVYPINEDTIKTLGQLYNGNYITVAENLDTLPEAAADVIEPRKKLKKRAD